MKTLSPDALVEEILNASKDEARGAFPYSDCENLARTAGVDCQRLVSDLDTYFYDVWSPSNGVKKLSKKSDAWLHDLKAYLDQSFFSSHAEYALLEAMINQDDTPALYHRLVFFDGLRKRLVLFLCTLLDQRGRERPDTAL